MKNTLEICNLFVPAEIISHLWNIVDLYGENEYIFVLTPMRLGDAIIQDIRINIDHFSFHHTVLGFHPVDFTVRVRRKGEDLEMSLVPSEKALYEINKWKSAKAALAFRKKRMRVFPII
ncbi:MAG: hypothetical protein CVU91_07925 [Firmicutes bacterium HGW-Firmicutes-16]|nr:MAG: hypothetical protein CVU91_07925 [Firmicutes bacterium HGW-Firmicutes-16]